MRATSAGATIGRVLNEPDEMVVCGRDLPDLEDAISEEGPGVAVDENGAVVVQENSGEQTTNGGQQTADSEVSDGDDEMCGYAMVFVGMELMWWNLRKRMRLRLVRRM
jgi:hypothetical protein